MRIGGIQLQPISDGTFVAHPAYFGWHTRIEGHEDLFSRDGKAWLPIGCFLIRTGARLVLVDAGLGPERRSNPGRWELVGGQLLVGLRAAGVTPDDITDVVCTHLHTDHVGWLFDPDGRPTFSRATIWLGAGDWDYFVRRGAAAMADHIREGLRTRYNTARVRPLEHDEPVAPGVNAVLTPGHTPGHLCIVVASGVERALLLGDAITCPVQLDEPTWHSLGDVDPRLAERTRERLWGELEGGHTLGVGAHFPELQFGRILVGKGRRWWAA